MSKNELLHNRVPDTIRPYLNEIAERLWGGRAAVMVGSGFSKNADNSFPDWNQLGDIFYKAAHGVTPSLEQKKYLNVLRLADEVKAAVGRPAMENLLRNKIPDLNVQPSTLHKDLLELPWADVFTTNYDTLLERASYQVVTRRYEPVVNKEDLPYAVRPRIIKLHGSFPSERPFIITEEDYRSYPKEFAPFVNSVQQALLENTFCLIGFSGEDPNFLEWIGWIRDNLSKDKTQKVYLIGLFGLSPASQQLWLERGVVVVDLICCDGIEMGEHGKALKLFFDYMDSKNKDTLSWPNECQLMMPSSPVEKIENIEKVIGFWRSDRKNYPGWLILPYDRREELWSYTRFWVNYLPNVDDNNLGLDIEYAYELVWRLERNLLPLFDHLAVFCEQMLKKYWPFKKNEQPDYYNKLTGVEEISYIQTREVRAAWLAISLSVLRFYREEGQLEKWKAKESKIKELDKYLSTEQKEFLNYERFLFYLFSLDFLSAKQCLQEWSPDESQPYWMAKRAAGLAEIGILHEAEKESKIALEYIRKKQNQNNSREDFTLESLESNAMLVGMLIQIAAGFGSRATSTREEKFDDRWNELKKFKCDPWNEIELFKLMLKGPHLDRETITKRHGFDIGRVTKKTEIHYGLDEDVANAYSFLRFCEEVGLPHRIGTLCVDQETTLSSLQRISKYSSFWASVTLIRLGDVKHVDNLFDRKFVCKLSVDEADQLVYNFLNVLEKCKDDIRVGNSFGNRNYGVDLAQTLPEIISRLCCKCSRKARLHIVRFLIDVYSCSFRANYLGVHRLVERLVGSMAAEEWYGLIPEFLKIRYLEDSKSIIDNEYVNPFVFFDVKSDVQRFPALVLPQSLVEELFQGAAIDDIERRRWSMTTLIILYSLQLIEKDNYPRLADVIWKVRDSFGLPKYIEVSRCCFLELPHPEDVEPVSIFKEYIKNTSLPIQKNIGPSVSMKGGDFPILRDIFNTGDIWTDYEIVGFLERLAEWWDADKEWLKEKSDQEPVVFNIANEFVARFSRLADILAKNIGPKLSQDFSENARSEYSRIVEEMYSFGLPCLVAVVAGIEIYPEQWGEIYKRVDRSLLSDINNVAVDGFMAASLVIINGHRVGETIRSSEVVELLSQCFSWIQVKSIIPAIRAVTYIVDEGAFELSGRLAQSVCRRLEMLLDDTDYVAGSVSLNFEERLVIRRAASSLSAKLLDRYNENNLDAPDVLESWRKSCIVTTEFAEVRNPWFDIGVVTGFCTD